MGTRNFQGLHSSCIMWKSFNIVSVHRSSMQTVVHIYDQRALAYSGLIQVRRILWVNMQIDTHTKSPRKTSISQRDACSALRGPNAHSDRRLSRAVRSRSPNLETRQRRSVGAPGNQAKWVNVASTADSCRAHNAITHGWYREKLSSPN